MKVGWLSALLVWLLAEPHFVSAHSGGLNSQGCHGGSRPYHCHRSSSEMVGNRLRCDLGSRSNQCRQTLNYKQTRKSPSSIQTLDKFETNAINPVEVVPEMDLLQSDQEFRKRVIMQSQERLKLMGLYEGAVDGVLGPKTKLAIDLFKLSKGFPTGGYLDEQSLIELGLESHLIDRSR